MTESNRDPEEWRAVISNRHHRDGLVKEFKDNNSTLKIVIVVDMWLTGFDVPSLATMYVYKPMQGYNLKLISEQVIIYRRTNVVKSEKFSEIIQQAMNRYLNGMLTNEQVIEELLNLAKQIQAAQKEGEQLGLTADELAFYDDLTKPQAIRDFYENEELIAITKELADALRNNRTIDWQKRDSARAKMRIMIKKLLKKHKYPPEGMDDAVQTVMLQCELWTDNNDMGERTDACAGRLGQYVSSTYGYDMERERPFMAAEDPVPYAK